MPFGLVNAPAVFQSFMNEIFRDLLGKCHHFTLTTSSFTPIPTPSTSVTLPPYFRDSVSTTCTSSLRNVSSTSPIFNIPRIYHHPQSGDHGSGESGSREELASAKDSTRTLTLPWVCEFLSPLHRNFSSVAAPHWKAFLSSLRFIVSLTSGYHPQANGQAERKIQDIGRYLRTYCHNQQHSWHRYLPWAEYAQNSLRQSSTGLTPFHCILCYQPPMFS